MLSGMKTETITYRGHRLQKIEWGLWRSLDDKSVALLYYRPDGRAGRCVRQFAQLSSALKLSDLQKHVRQVRANITKSKLGIPTEHGLAATVAEYLADLKRRKVSATHYDIAERILNGLAETHPQAAAGDLTAADTSDYLSSLQSTPRRQGAEPKPLSPATQNKYRAVVHSYLEFCRKRQYIDTNPAEHVDRVKDNHRLVQFPTPFQLYRLVQRSDRDAARCFMFLTLTGLRRDSFLSLTPDCFTDDGILVPRTKRGQEWFIRYDDGCPLWSQELSKLGRAIWKERTPTRDWLRFHMKGTGFTLHGFRHACCSWQVMMGESTSDIAVRLHHSSPAITEKHYAHLRPRGRDRIDRNRKHVRKVCARLFRMVLP